MDLKKLLPLIEEIAIQAGDITLKHFDPSGYDGAEIKKDGSPVTKADREAEAFIETELLKILPMVLMIGEEGASEAKAVQDVSDQDYFWSVDPLDGTKEFVSGGREYTVNIALIHKGVPVLGVVYAPVLGEIYVGYTDADGNCEAKHKIISSGVETVMKTRTPPAEGLSVASSKSNRSAKEKEAFLAQFKVKESKTLGSSLKICAVAAGKADIYVQCGTTSEWDTAAGDAILRAAGSHITDLQGKPLVYGAQKDSFVNPKFVAAGFEWPAHKKAPTPKTSQKKVNRQP